METEQRRRAMQILIRGGWFDRLKVRQDVIDTEDRVKERAALLRQYQDCMRSSEPETDRQTLLHSLGKIAYAKGVIIGLSEMEQDSPARLKSLNLAIACIIEAERLAYGIIGIPTGKLTEFCSREIQLQPTQPPFKPAPLQLVKQ